MEEWTKNVHENGFTVQPLNAFLSELFSFDGFVDTHEPCEEGGNCKYGTCIFPCELTDNILDQLIHADMKHGKTKHPEFCKQYGRAALDA